MPCHPPVFILPASLNILRAGRCLFAHLRSIAFRIRFAQAAPAGDAFLTFMFSLGFSFCFLPALLVMANRLRIPLRSMPNLSPAPCLFPFLFKLRAGPCLLRDRCYIAFRFRIAQSAPAGSSSLTVMFFPFLQVFLRQIFTCPISLSCYCGWSAIPLRSMPNQPHTFISLTS